MPYHVFLSYSRKDNDIMQQVKTDLQAAALSVWTDEGIEPGSQSWKRAIEDHLNEVNCLVVLFSPDSKQSRWVRAEIDYAELLDKPVLPLLVRGDQRTAVPFGWATAQWIDMRDAGIYPAGIARLIEVVGKYVDGSITIAHDAPSLADLLPPPFEWREVPKGDVSTQQGSDVTVSQLRRFFIAKYPVTNAQYQAFANAPDGYRNPDWWGFSSAALRWRHKNRVPARATYPGDDVPRVKVTWYEAVAFARWLSANTGTAITLPTEQQWVRAARGDDDRLYPWGNNADESRANTKDTDATRPVNVTDYPTGASPYGVLDMSGNVAEWCLNRWDDDSLILETTSLRVLRGGSYSVMLTDADLNKRTCRYPNMGANNIGFRIVCNVIPMMTDIPSGDPVNEETEG